MSHLCTKITPQLLLHSILLSFSAQAKIMTFHHHEGISLIIAMGFIFLKAHQVLLAPDLPRSHLASHTTLQKYFMC